MPALSHGERVIRSALMTSAAIVSALTLGIGYQQQTSGGAMRATLALPMEEEIDWVDIDTMEFDMFLDQDGGAFVEESLVWCCNSDVGMCYEQTEENGCGKDGIASDDFDTCAATCGL